MTDLIDFNNNETADEIASLLIRNAFTELLETKHLYQSVEIPWERQQYRIYGQRKGTAAEVESALKTPWFLLNMAQGSSSYSDPKSAPPLRFYVSFPRVRILCPFCEERPWFQLDNSLVAQLDPKRGVSTLALQCQSCDGKLFFLVTRNALKLTLTGRSEIERVQIPRYVPKALRRFYEGAVIAYNTGECLAGLFMLRTMIEQHMRRTIEDLDVKLTGEQLADKYNERLPEAFKSTAPSLKVVYATLSSALHGADDTAPFEEIQTDILLHFEHKGSFDRIQARGKRKSSD